MLYEVIHKLELLKAKYVNVLSKESIEELDNIIDILYHVIANVK